MRGAGAIVDRKPQRDFQLKLPPGARVVSADDHWEITDDIFYENFPADLKDKAPRVWFDQYPHSEGSFGFGRSSIQAVADAVSPEAARAILGGTAIELFKLDS